MAKKKTRQQKIKSALRKKQGVGEIQVSRPVRRIEFGYDPKLIRKDLLKTVIVCVLILGVELAIYIWFKW